MSTVPFHRRATIRSRGGCASIRSEGNKLMWKDRCFPIFILGTSCALIGASCALKGNVILGTSCALIRRAMLKFDTKLAARFQVIQLNHPSLWTATRFQPPTFPMTPHGRPGHFRSLRAGEYELYDTFAEFFRQLRGTPRRCSATLQTNRCEKCSPNEVSAKSLRTSRDICEKAAYSNKKI